METLRGKKASLRPMKPKEVELIHKWANNPDVIPHWYGKKMSLKEIKDDWKPHYFNDNDPYSGRCFAIEVDDKPIGMVNYNEIDKDNQKVEIDIIIGERNNWNKGYGTDALKTLISYLFKKFKINRIWLAPYLSNPRAIRAYEKVGFRREGILRENSFINGKFVDDVMLSVIRREFKA